MCLTSLNSSLHHYKPPLLTPGSATFLKAHPALQPPDALPVLFWEVPLFLSGDALLQVTSAPDREPSARESWPSVPGHRRSMPGHSALLAAAVSWALLPLHSVVFAEAKMVPPLSQKRQHLWRRVEFPEMVTQVCGGCFPRCALSIVLCAPYSVTLPFSTPSSSPRVGIMNING